MVLVPTAGVKLALVKTVVNVGAWKVLIEVADVAPIFNE